jgi:leucyl aminopeptidase
MTPPRFLAVDATPADAPVLGVPVFSDLSTPAGAGAQVDRRFLVQRGFDGQPGQAQALLANDGSTVIALGVGPARSVTADVLRQAGAALARQSGNASRMATTLAAAAPDPDLAAAVVEGIGLGAYRYAGAPVRKGDRRPLRQVSVVGASRDAVKQGRVAVDATWRARDWINTPPRELTPRVLAELAVEAAQGAGVDVEIWDEHRIADERLGALLGVAAGASEPPRLIHLDYHPEDAQATLAFVGKGITFDSGGLSLKTAAGMMTMKDDMGGAAAVICATVAAAELGLPVRVMTWVAATENMPSGTATHPGDVLTARNGKRIEVLNTDAEGRLVLADALSLAVEQKPDVIVDVATLTGGQVVALGRGVGAVFGSDRDVVRQVIGAGERAGEPTWELPLHDGYRKDLDSQVADLKNVTGDTAASAIMAALFLQEFTGRRPWAHLDIAGPAWSDKEEGWISRGGTGWATRTLIELARGWT